MCGELRNRSPGFFDLPMAFQHEIDDLGQSLDLTTFIDEGSSTSSSAPPHPSSRLPLSKERNAQSESSEK